MIRSLAAKSNFCAFSHIRLGFVQPVWWNLIETGLIGIKYQLSQMDTYALRPLPHAYRAVDRHGRSMWKTGRRPSPVLSTQVWLTTVRFIQYITLSVHLCRAKLTTRCDDRRAAANFNAEFATKFQKEVLLFLEIREFFQKNGVG